MVTDPGHLGLMEEWRKSSYSGGEGNCLEAARMTTGRAGVRDSKVSGGDTLIFPPEAWDGFVQEIRRGRI